MSTAQVNWEELTTLAGRLEKPGTGPGSLPETGKSARSYRDPKTLNALATFWKAWFGKSNANLVEFGMPALLNPVK